MASRWIAFAPSCRAGPSRAGPPSRCRRSARNWWPHAGRAIRTSGSRTHRHRRRRATTAAARSEADARAGAGRAGGDEAPQHRLRARRRLFHEPRAVHAAGPPDAEGRRHLRQLLRHGFAVLPVALVDLHRALPAQHRHLPQCRPGRRLSRLSQARPRARDLRRGARGGGLSHRDARQVSQRISAEDARGRAGMERMGRGRQRLWRVQLRPQSERARSTTTVARPRTI